MSCWLSSSRSCAPRRSRRGRSSFDAFPARALQAFAERDGADLIVVGAPHRAGAERVLGGDVAAGTLREAPCAVTVAPAGFAEREPTAAQRRGGLRRLDRVARGPAAGRAAGACAAGAALRVVSVASGDGAEHEAAALAEGGNLRGRRRQAAPRELVRRSADLDLLVVGSRAQGPVRRLLLGSTSARLVREARCPVLVVPRPVVSRPAPRRPSGARRRGERAPHPPAAAAHGGGDRDRRCAHLAGAPKSATRSGPSRWRSCSCR